MSAISENDKTTGGRPVNGTGDALRTRIADLLDDVTVAPTGGYRSADARATPSVASAREHGDRNRSVPEFPYDKVQPPETGAPDQSSTPGAVPSTPAAAALPPIAPRETAPADELTAPPSTRPAPAPSPDKQAPTPDVGNGQPPGVSSSEPLVPKASPAINIRGRSDGVAIEIGKGPWSEIVAALADRLDQSAGFFRNAQVALDIGPRPVDEGDLRQVVDVLDLHNMRLGALRTSAERTFQAALALGITATLESAEGASVAAATPATTNELDGAYFVYRGYLRSGHRLRRKEHVLVIGDVNPGAEVISDGDVYIWGRLRGVVHAGVNGDSRALVAALDMEPTQLRIAEVIAIGADPKPGGPGRWFWKKSQHKRPEVARLNNGEMFVEEWDISRPGGIASLRRGG